MSLSDRRSREIALRREFDTLQNEWPALVGWSLVINERMRSVFGRCNYGRRALYLPGWHVDHGEWADVLDTLRHEAAHALAGPTAGHGPKWRSWARRLGSEARRCGSREAWAKSPAAKDGPKWSISCRKCGLVTHLRRRSAGWERARHRGCGGRLEWVQVR